MALTKGYVNYTGKTLAGMAASNSSIYGTNKADVLNGTNKNDWFFGNSGVDRMTGGKGDDTYQVYDKNAVVIENEGEGIDMVRSSVTYTLPDHVEILSLSLTDTTGYGNALDNVIMGLGGRQTLNGLGGNDVLIGGEGNDIFVMAKGGGVDVIADFVNGVDTVRLDGFGLTSFDQVKSLLTQVGNDVKLTLESGEGFVFSNHKIGDFSANDFKLAIDTSKLNLTFADEFNTLSLQSAGGLWKTTYNLSGITAYTLTSNNEAQLYVDPNFKGSGSTSLGLNPFNVTDGVLNITASRVTEEQSEQMWGYDYASGLLTTRGTFAQQYGYFEINAKLPAGQGLWPAFWLLPNDGTWPAELDVLEQLGRDPTTIWMSSISKAGGKMAYTHEIVDLPTATTEFHKYGVLWDKDHLTYYIDGVEVGRVPTPADMHKPMYMLVNLAVGGSWAGAPNADTTGTYSLDYVHAYSLDQASGAIGNANPGDSPSNGSTSGETTTPAPTVPVTPSTPVVLFKNGTDGADTLNGASGQYKLAGGKGNDTYLVDSDGDVVTEHANEGTDTVASSISYTLGANVENLRLQGSSAIDGAGNELANTITGNAGANVLSGMAGNDNITGGDGNDIIIGGAGNDFMYGGNGNDTFVIGAGDLDATGKGYDKIFDFEGAGQAGGDVLRFDGFSAGSTLKVDTSAYSKGFYADGSGNKVYVYKLTDVATGRSEVIHVTSKNGQALTSEDYSFTAAASTTPAANPSASTGTAAKGPNLAARIGTDGNDTIDGKGGDFRLVGGLGNDTYVVDSAGDIVEEAANAGTDKVHASVSHTLSDNVENLTFLGSGAFDGTGNALNVITGNSAANVLSGMDGNDNLIGAGGNDTLKGGRGNDFLQGGAGDDTFVIGAGDLDANGKGYDKIFDFEGAGKAGGDVLQLEGFGAGSTFALDTSAYNKGQYTDGSGHSVFVYKLTDTTSHYSETVHVTSLSGLALTQGDFGFYG